MESSSKTSTHQEEPLDLTVGNNNGIGELADDQQHIMQFMESCGMVLQQNMFAWLLQSMLETAASQSQTASDEPSEKENVYESRQKSPDEKTEVTSSPAQVRRRTSTGKVDRRMIGKMCTRRVEANARERNRVQQLSKMFDQLRECLPMEDESKISKLATLKVASAYIGFLGSLLKEDSEEEEEEFRKKLQAELESAKSLRK